ncbi:molecular chaperone [Pseudoalteromonas rubra]|uniref:Molecular chaperone n=1 Tax=Pseudoalteromonas rubra TaxID=43658 RepID=A0A5S3WJG9_9GAMM|nr:molecular chaperone [Pseudoalteromonas rubra]TMP27258.1 molecular chaperone [Pseudoalteromonas rubra]TMP36796.1 molecular chaperone [Pseudoalteromonas rubra]
MIAGFDYGSSNCAIGVMREGDVTLVPLEQGKHYLPSTLYALHNSLVSEFVAHKLAGSALATDYQSARKPLLSSAAMARRELDLQPTEQGLFVGQQAIEEYIAFPEEGYFVKSPKSFFGAVGLKPAQLAFFEDIATAMIMEIKSRAEHHLGYSLSHTVIGRPVNFQAIGGEQSNRQAIDILTVAAKRAGFKDVEFLYEPLAAGIDYESRLTEDQKVLVVDIGGGTSDCSFVQMGPGFRDKADRSADFLAHSGKRIGGNDLDIALAFHTLMPVCGLGGQFTSGLPLPNPLFWQACKINDIQMQSDFYSEQMQRELTGMLRDVCEPEKLQRLLKIQENKMTHQFVRQGELAKIALSELEEHAVPLDFLDKALSVKVSAQTMAESVASCLEQAAALAEQAIVEAETQPDVIYLTGGSAQSPLLKLALQQRLGDIPMVNGDNFGSVTAGLTKWANRLYQTG